VGTALRADRLIAERAVLDPGYHFVGAVAVVKRAHDDEVGLSAVGARRFVNDKVAGMALVHPLALGNIFEVFVFFCEI
jgi:hypothetical protein